MKYYLLKDEKFRSISRNLTIEYPISSCPSTISYRLSNVKYSSKSLNLKIIQPRFIRSRRIIRRRKFRNKPSWISPWSSTTRQYRKKFRTLRNVQCKKKKWSPRATNIWGGERWKKRAFRAPASLHKLHARAEIGMMIGVRIRNATCSTLVVPFLGYVTWEVSRVGRVNAWPSPMARYLV